MNSKSLGLIAGLTLTVGLVSCVDIPTAPEAMPTVANKEAKSKSRVGNFVGAEHPTSGNVKIVNENGTYFIEFDKNFKTSDNGPDLYVILHRSPDISKISQPPDYGIAEGDYALIAPLKSPSGKQRYEIPQYLQSGNYQSVAVWCRKFNATFGFAALSSN
jgi:hypothetical protein